MAHYNSEIRVPDSVEIQSICLDTEENKFSLDLTKYVVGQDGERHFINFEVSMPLELIKEVMELLPIAIEKAKEIGRAHV